jgi:hypothetical protein
MALISPKTARAGLDFQQAVDRFGLDTSRLGQAFGRPARGRTEQASHLLGPEDQQDGVDERRFAYHAGSGMMGTMPGTGICRAA